jgi:hypothetical protein
MLACYLIVYPFSVIICTEHLACTGRPIPSNLTAAVTGALMTDELFNTSISEVEYIYGYQLLYNNSLYSKLAMGNPLWKIKQRILAATTAGNEDFYQFVLIGAHDTTIMPMLAAMLGESWDGLWAGYASLLTFELYNTTTAGSFLVAATRFVTWIPLWMFFRSHRR